HARTVAVVSYPFCLGPRSASVQRAHKKNLIRITIEVEVRPTDVDVAACCIVAVVHRQPFFVMGLQIAWQAERGVHRKRPGGPAILRLADGNSIVPKGVGGQLRMVDDTVRPGSDYRIALPVAERKQ